MPPAHTHTQKQPKKGYDDGPWTRGENAWSLSHIRQSPSYWNINITQFTQINGAKSRPTKKKNPKTIQNFVNKCIFLPSSYDTYVTLSFSLSLSHTHTFGPAYTSEKKYTKQIHSNAPQPAVQIHLYNLYNSLDVWYLLDIFRKVLVQRTRTPQTQTHTHTHSPVNKQACGCAHERSKRSEEENYINPSQPKSEEKK